MSIKQIILLAIVLCLTLFIRLYQLDQIPFGLNIDEASMGYNAYSLSQTGKDRYGQAFPIIFRSFGSFQAPLYTYLIIPFVQLFGTSIFTVHLVSALSGFIIVCCSFLISYFGFKKNFYLAIIATMVVGFSPWSILFTRVGTEASLGLALFTLSITFFVLSQNRIIFLIPATFFLGMATHAYYSERLTSIFFFIGYVLLFFKKFVKQKKWLVLTAAVFIITLLPHLVIVQSGAFTRRLEQVNYFSEETFLKQGDNLRNLPLGRVLYIIREFSSQYITYFSPKNLFFEADPQPARSMPDLSVFYSWMVAPYFIGIYYLVKNRSFALIKILILIITISPIPAALTRDPFYTLRTLVFLWSISFTIAFGIYSILIKIPYFYLKLGLITILLLFSSVSLYTSYFILFKYERAENFGYSYIKLLEFIEEDENFSKKKFVIDNSRDLGAGVRMAYLKRYDPVKLQQTLSLAVGDKYYSSLEFEEKYDLDNIEARPIFWKRDVYEEQILIGDSLAISDEQIEEHFLKFEFEIKDIQGNVKLKGYSTNPKVKDKSDELKKMPQNL